MKRASITALLFCALMARAQAADFTPPHWRPHRRGNGTDRADCRSHRAAAAISLWRQPRAPRRPRQGSRLRQGNARRRRRYSEALRAGVFAAPGKSYDAWVRFSNATGVVTADYDTAHDTNTWRDDAPLRRAGAWRSS